MVFLNDLFNFYKSNRLQGERMKTVLAKLKNVVIDKIIWKLWGLDLKKSYSSKTIINHAKAGGEAKLVLPVLNLFLAQNSILNIRQWKKFVKGLSKYQEYATISVLLFSANIHGLNFLWFHTRIIFDFILSILDFLIRSLYESKEIIYDPY